MKTTKKDVYAQFGIEYKNGKIYHEKCGFIRPLLKNGNAKIGRGCYHFSLLPTNKVYHAILNGEECTIKGTCACHCAGCYATAGNYRFQNVVNSLALNTALIRDDLEFVKRAITAQLIADGIKQCRIHAAGDFDSVEYAGMWKEIALEFPGIVFWTYTKRPDCERLFDGVPNANIVKSIIPGYGFNYGHAGYVAELYTALKAAGKSVHICKCGTDKNQHCADCKGCMLNEYVLFLEHSTDYKAENDPDYAGLKALIERQN